MHNIGTSKRINKSDQVTEVTVYKAINCNGPALKEMYYKSKGNRRVELNHTLRDYETKVNELLKSEQGIYHRKKRTYDVEPVFTNIKHNKNFKRFNLQGIKKVEIETGLIALAHNFKKIAA